MRRRPRREKTIRSKPLRKNKNKRKKRKKPFSILLRNPHFPPLRSPPGRKVEMTDEDRREVERRKQTDVANLLLDDSEILAEVRRDQVEAERLARKPKKALPEKSKTADETRKIILPQSRIVRLGDGRLLRPFLEDVLPRVNKRPLRKYYTFSVYDYYRPKRRYGDPNREWRWQVSTDRTAAITTLARSYGKKDAKGEIIDQKIFDRARIQKDSFWKIGERRTVRGINNLVSCLRNQCVISVFNPRTEDWILRTVSDSEIEACQKPLARREEIPFSLKVPSSIALVPGTHLFLREEAKDLVRKEVRDARVLGIVGFTPDGRVVVSVDGDGYVCDRVVDILLLYEKCRRKDRA